MTPLQSFVLWIRRCQVGGDCRVLFVARAPVLLYIISRMVAVFSFLSKKTGANLVPRNPTHHLKSRIVNDSTQE